MSKHFPNKSAYAPELFQLKLTHVLNKVRNVPVTQSHTKTVLDMFQTYIDMFYICSEISKHVLIGDLTRPDPT